MRNGEDGGDRDEDQHAEAGKLLILQNMAGKEADSEEGSAEEGIIHRLGEDVVLEEKGQKIVHLAQHRIAGEGVPGDEVEAVMKEIEFRDGEVIDQRVLAVLRCQGQHKTCEKEDTEEKQGRELPNGTPGRRCRSGPDGAQPPRHGKQRQGYQQKTNAGGSKRTCNAEEKNGVTGDDETNSGREEKPFTPGGEADGGCVQTEPSDARCDQTPTGQEKDRYSLLNKCRSHGFLWA